MRTSRAIHRSNFTCASKYERSNFGQFKSWTSASNDPEVMSRVLKGNNAVSLTLQYKPSGFRVPRAAKFRKWRDLVLVPSKYIVLPCDVCGCDFMVRKYSENIRACRRHRRGIVNTNARFTQSRIADRTRTPRAAMPRSPNLSDTGYRDFFDSRRGFVKSLTKTTLKSPMLVTPRNQVVSRLLGKPFLTVSSERYKVLFFFRATFEGRNARGIAVFLSFVSRS